MSNPALLSLSARLTVGRPQVFRKLVVVPLLDRAAPPTGWLTLDQAIGRGHRRDQRGLRTWQCSPAEAA
jgi:hypothetical protein